MADLANLQERIRQTRAARGFVTDPVKIHLLLTEEVGEIAAELKRLWSPNYTAFDSERLSDELADTFVLLCALASEFDIDIEQAVETKFFARDAQRRWQSAQPDGQGGE